MDLLTISEMRSLEAGAIASGQTSGLELMERAGRAVVETFLRKFPKHAKTPGRAVIFCGPGNNGGDGFAVARLLKERGWQIEVLFAGTAENLPPDAKAMYLRWAEIGESILVPNGLPDAHYDLAVDALFGIGLTRPISQDLAQIWQKVTASADTRIAIDIPSGLCAMSGKLRSSEDSPDRFPFSADLTVTFHNPKLGHHLAEGPHCCGDLVVADIGLSQNPEDPGRVRLSIQEGLPKERLRKGNRSHKYSSGHAFVLSGGVGKGGAARLAARAALRVGAGLVTLGCPPAAIIENAAQLNAIMLRATADPEEFSEILEDKRISALCLGPGLGVERARKMVPVALKSARPIVLDADALTAYSEAPDHLFSALHHSAVLVPHSGEFARLFPDLAERLSGAPDGALAFSKVDAVKEAAKRSGAVVLLKGPDTVISAPDGGTMVQSAAYGREAPWLATAGSGDVLAGLISGLLARGLSPSEAAEAGAWLHVEAGRRFGPGLVAEDLPELIPTVFQDIGV